VGDTWIFNKAGQPWEAAVVRLASHLRKPCAHERRGLSQRQCHEFSRYIGIRAVDSVRAEGGVALSCPKAGSLRVLSVDAGLVAPLAQADLSLFQEGAADGTYGSLLSLLLITQVIPAVHPATEGSRGVAFLLYEVSHGGGQTFLPWDGDDGKKLPAFRFEISGE